MTARLFLRLLRRPSAPAVPVTTAELQDWRRRRAEAEADRRKPEVLCDRELTQTDAIPKTLRRGVR